MFPQPTTHAKFDPESVAVWLHHVKLALPRLRQSKQGIADIPAASASLLGCIVLIEPRESKLIEFVIRAAVSCLPGWGLCVVHGTNNADFVRRVTADFPNVCYIDAGVPDLPSQAYNTLLTSELFWSSLPHEHLLFIQTDVAVLRSIAASDEIFGFDYVGAPWSYNCVACSAITTKSKAVCGHMIDHKALQVLSPNLVGNGGFSFRKKSRMLQACNVFRLANRDKAVEKVWGEASKDSKTLADVTQEDVFFSLAVSLSGGKVAPRDVALRFSIEQIPPVLMEWGKPSACGVHKPWVYLPKQTVEAILSGASYLTN
jgi:hypothetical protein